MRWALPAVFVLLSQASPLAAQTTNAAGAEDGSSLQQRAIGFLSQQDQDRVIAAYNKALADNPKLGVEREELEKGWSQLPAANSHDRMAFTEKNRTHEQKLRQAMLKEDPALGPILDQIDKHLSTMRAQGQKAAAGGNGTP